MRPPGRPAARPSRGAAGGPLWGDRALGPVQVYELHGAAGPGPATSQEATPFVGRTAELAQLECAWADVRQGRGRVVSIVGEAGIGKSRLLRELAHRVAAEGAPYLAGSCYAYADAITYLPFQQVLRARFGMEQTAPALAAGRVAQRLAALALDAALVSFVATLLGFPADDLCSAACRPTSCEPAPSKRPWRYCWPRRAASRSSSPSRTSTGLTRARKRSSARSSRRCPDVPLLLVLAYRPEHLHPWGGAESHTTITLDPLPRASAAALARGVLARPQAAQVSLAALPPAEAEALAHGAAQDREPAAGPRAPRGPAGGRQSALRRGANARAARRRPRRYRPIRHRRPRHRCRRCDRWQRWRAPPTVRRRARGGPVLHASAPRRPGACPVAHHPARPGPRPARPAAHRAGRAAGAGRSPRRAAASHAAGRRCHRPHL